MKLRTHLLVFFGLLILNFSLFYYFGLLKPRVLPEKIKFKSLNSEEALVIKKNASGTIKLEINFGGACGELRATVDNSSLEKLKYKAKDEDGDKSLYAYVKYSKNGDFKLFNSNDKLLWKIKVDQNKIKIANNEEGKNPLEIKTTTKNGKTKIKVYNIKGVNIASVKHGDGKLKIKKVVSESEKEDLYSTKDINYLSMSVGILAISEIPAKERAIILTELLRKGK